MVPRDGVFDDRARRRSIDGCEHLDESFVAIQGPPGTGKTYSRLAHHSPPHRSRTARGRAGDEPRRHRQLDARRRSRCSTRPATSVNCAHCVGRRRRQSPSRASNTPRRRVICRRGEFNLIGGTAWLWANAEMRQCPRGRADRGRSGPALAWPTPSPPAGGRATCCSSAILCNWPRSPRPSIPGDRARVCSNTSWVST